MNQLTHGDESSRPGGRRARPRWWVVGLAGMTGLALTTTVGIAASPAAGAVGHALPAASDRPENRPSAHDGYDKHDDGKSKVDRGEGDQEKRPKGIPVPCDADKLIAAITLANARGGAVLDLAKDCTYLLIADIDGAGLPAITAPITLNGGKNTTIERAAAVDPFRIFTVDVGGNLTLNKLTITGGVTTSDGGGILVNPGGATTINHSKIRRNIASENGGGISSEGTVVVTQSTIDRNSSIREGGGIFSTGTLEVVKSDIDSNTTATGGGIRAPGGTATIKGSTKLMGVG